MLETPHTPSQEDRTSTPTPTKFLDDSLSPPPPLDSFDAFGSEAATLHDAPTDSPPKQSRKRVITRAGVVLAIFLIVVAAVVVPVLLTHYLPRRKHSGAQTSTNGDGQTSHGPTAGKDSPTSGKSGSVVQAEDGSTFVYVNDFGGDWAADPRQPFAPGGKAQSWSKRVGSEEWIWGTDQVRGVNLGGWLVTEPFIVPELFEKYNAIAGVPVRDEWDLSIAMGDNLAQEMEHHYSTFITESDFAEIAAAGLNWVRIPLGFWALETVDDEPFLKGTSWTYFLKAVQWARKYGIRIYLDFHALPGSQNGWNHSGKGGAVNFMHGAMGIANAQRTLSYLRTLAEFISQDQYKDVVCVLGIVNEVMWETIGKASVQSFYRAAYDTIRDATGVGAGAGPYIAIHEGFQGPANWEGFLEGSDRVILDQHPYLAFYKGPPLASEQLVKRPCDWAGAINRSSNVFGVTFGGEFSAALNDCGLWVNGVGSKPSHGDCSVYDNWESYDQATLDTLKTVTLASMDALQNFFFWTWKIGNSTVLGTSSSPMWHYKLGLERGWIPKDPREAIGHCSSLAKSVPFTALPATATGGAGAGILKAPQSYPFPPATLLPSFSGTQIALLPTYTQTGAAITLPAPTFTATASVDAGNGWKNAQDTALAYVPVKGCSYPNAWDAVTATLPTAPCTG
ncbi:hypothetical protein ONZ45_g15358 [Pleurotus djamor]|nr:hypothetical protein ONZ45_g15358 [Pleurotus djamor]